MELRMLGARRMVLIPFIVAWVLSVGCLFLVDADWGFIHQVAAMPSTVVTCLILWAVAPFLMLLPIALRENRFEALPAMAVLVVFAVGAFFIFDHQHRMPGNEGLDLVVPAE